MTVWDIVLITMAVAVGVFAFQIRQVLLGDKWVYVSTLFVALAAIVAVLVLTSHFYDNVLNEAEGSRDWTDNGFIRALCIYGPPAFVGYWAWALTMDKESED